MEDPDLWQWIWLAATLAFVLGEMMSAGSFFLLPFGVGALVADGLAFSSVTIGWQWAAFVAVSGGTFAALRPFAHREEARTPGPSGIGADRWVGRVGIVLSDIPPGPNELGSVRVDREVWRAESADGGAVSEGTRVEVVEVQGTRVVVRPVTSSPVQSNEE